MIVTCGSCQTRFRIADEKIGARGARVRCGRCKALFVVRREEPPPPAAAGPPEPPPPQPFPPPAPPPEGTQGLDIELTSDPFALPRPRRDDPFARAAAPPGDPFASPPADPFAAAPAAPAPPAGAPGVPDPFAPPPAPDPFLEAAFASAPPPGAPAPTPPAMTAPSGGIALEEAVHRPPPTPMPGYESGFGMPADFRTPGPSGLEVAQPPAEEVPPPAPPAARPVAAAAAPEPEPAAEPAELPTPLARRAASMLLNSASLLVLLLLAGALFVTWKGGGTAALWATLGRGPEDGLAARHVQSGLYDTASGRPALFVRGEVVAPGGSTAPVKVRVELLDGERKVAGGEGLSGALPSPEEIWSVAGPEAEARLRAQLSGRGVRLEPNRPVPFLVVLWEHPIDLRGLDLRVVAEPDAGR